MYFLHPDLIKMIKVDHNCTVCGTMLIQWIRTAVVYGKAAGA